MSQAAAFPRVLEFVGRAAPFDTLGPGELMAVVEAMEIAYHPAGQVVAQAGQPLGAFHLIQTGSAKLTQPLEGGRQRLVDVRGEGESFGAQGLLAGGPYAFSVTAREDLICYQLPAAVFQDLCQRHAAFRAHFAGGLARPSLELPRPAAQARALDLPGLEASLIASRLDEIMSKDVLTCLPATTVRAAAHLMSLRRVGSVVVTEESGHPLGIVTDRDLRSRVLAAGLGPDIPVLQIMSQPVHALSPRHHAFEALLAMSRHGVHHVVVTRRERVVGIISDHDLRGLTGSSPVAVVRDIEKAASLEELVAVRHKIDRVLSMLLSLGGAAPTMLALVTEFNDRLTLRLLELVENDLENQGLGRPPLPYAWLAMGSEGRREQTLRTDQDNALVFTPAPPARQAEITQWFLEFGRRVVEGLVACGFPPCPGQFMASNPQWCQDEAQWLKAFRLWLAQADPLSLRLATVFFDFRALYAEADFEDNLRAGLFKALEAHRPFLRFLAQSALYNRPPLGFLRQFVVEKSGEHKHKLNLKLSGLTPIVDGARVMALDQGIQATGTLERLEQIGQAGLLKPALVADLAEAFGFVSLLRVGQHLKARGQGQPPDNFVNPADLTGLQRKMLKESFGVISQLQDMLEYRYQTRLIAG